MPVNKFDFRFDGDQFLMGRKAKEEDEVDVENRTETNDLTEPADGKSLSAKTDSQQKGKSDGKFDGKLGVVLGYSPHKKFDCSGKSPISSSLFPPQITGSGIPPEANSAQVPIAHRSSSPFEEFVPRYIPQSHV